MSDLNQALLVSNALLWLAVLALCAVVLALVRQLGVLYERVAPAGALMFGQGPKVGEAAPVVEVVDLGGVTHQVGAPAPSGKSRLLFFLSPTCPVCKELLPALRSIARGERAWLGVLLASDGPRPEHEAFVRAQALAEFPYLLSPTLGVTYQVSKLPYAALVDERGVLRARGLVNTREHLESLFEASARRVASLQDYLARDGAEGERSGVR